MSKIKASLLLLPLVLIGIFDVYFDSNSMAENDASLVIDRLAAIEAEQDLLQRAVDAQDLKVREEVRRGIDIQFINYIKESNRRSREKAAKKQDTRSVVQNK